MDGQESLARRFEAERPRLRSVAYRMLGTLADADDAVQEAWLHAGAADAGEVRNLPGWLTTVVARVCLNMLRVRRARPESPSAEPFPDPLISELDAEPEHRLLLADAVGLAVQVVLAELAPAERVAFVLHDLFALPFDEIAPVLGRSPAAARKLASRARQRLRVDAARSDGDPAVHRAVVEAFLAAARGGDLGALVALLDPQVVLRADTGPGGRVELRGARAVGQSAHGFAWRAEHARPILVNGGPGLVAADTGTVFAVLGFTLVDGRIAAIDILADPARLRLLDLLRVVA